MASTVTWTQTSRYTGTPTISTNAQAITAIIAAIAAKSTKWTVNASASDYVELKATGSPTGDLGTVRILIFGGGTPNAGALNASIAANTAALYVAMCVDSGGTITQAYTTGNPYNGKSRVILGTPMVVTGNYPSATVYVNIVETDDIIHIGIGQSGAASYTCMTAGRIIVDPSGVARWGVFGCVSLMASAGLGSDTDPWIIPGAKLTGSAPAYGWMEIDSSGTIRPVGRISGAASFAGTSTILDDTVDAYFLPVYLSRSRTLAVSSNNQYAGVARQMKLGKGNVTCGQSITVGGVTKGYAVCTDNMSGTHPCWFSTDP